MNILAFKVNIKWQSSHSGRAIQVLNSQRGNKTFIIMRGEIAHKEVYKLKIVPSTCQQLSILLNAQSYLSCEHANTISISISDGVPRSAMLVFQLNNVRLSLGGAFCRILSSISKCVTIGKNISTSKKSYTLNLCSTRVNLVKRWVVISMHRATRICCCLKGLDLQLCPGPFASLQSHNRER